jgi:predicted MFS family arabinose efflux permease
VKITRDLGAPDATFGLAISGVGIGSLAGAVAATRLGTRTNVALVLLASTFATGVILLGLAAAGSVAVIVTLMALVGLFEIVIIVTYVTLRTAYSPDALLGRIGSTARVVSLGIQPIGMIVGGILIDAIGGTETIAVMGVGLCLLALVFVPVRPLRGATLAPQGS